MDISVVVPTCNRKTRLLSLLKNLENSVYPIREIIIIDSGEELLSENDYQQLKKSVIYLRSEKSVCIQRNIGIRRAASDWIFLCDDDIEIPTDYLQKLSQHIGNHKECGAATGILMEKENNEWKGSHPETSNFQLIWKFVFQLGIWGEIKCGNFVFFDSIKKYYAKKRNHISIAGWPVLTNFSSEYFTAPVYALGASLIKKSWLENSLYDEVLDRHGIGDNYGVACGFPAEIHVLNDTMAYHHLEPTNRLKKPLQYYRRALALDFFIKTKPALRNQKRRWLIWSLTGNLVRFFVRGDWFMIRAALKPIWVIAIDKNPYYMASKKNQKITEPTL